MDNSYDEKDIDGATKFQKAKITISTQSYPTNNLKAHMEGMNQDTYREVDQLSPTDLQTSLPGGNLPRHAPRSQVRCLPRSPPSSVWRFQSGVHPWRWHDGHQSGLCTMSMLSVSMTDDYWPQAIFNGALHEGLRKCTITGTLLHIMPATEDPINAMSYGEAQPPCWFRHRSTPKCTSYGNNGRWDKR